MGFVSSGFGTLLPGLGQSVHVTWCNKYWLPRYLTQGSVDQSCTQAVEFRPKMYYVVCSVV